MLELGRSNEKHLTSKGRRMLRTAALSVNDLSEVTAVITNPKNPEKLNSFIELLQKYPLQIPPSSINL
jgi:hypothetical protein